MKKINLFGVEVTNATGKEILEYVLHSLGKKEENYYIVTPNPEIIMFSQKNVQFKEILNKAKIALCDGVGLLLASKIMGNPLKERVTGVDLMLALCKEVSEKPITVGFLGGGPKVAETTAECLKQQFVGLTVVFTASEWPDSKTDLESLNSKFKIQNSKLQLKSQNYPKQKNSNFHLSSFNSQLPIDILFVAFGFPKQEEWMAKHLDKGVYHVAIGVGGAFDYISGNVARAPRFIRALGFEWLFRLIRQPWRIKRQLMLLEFVYLVYRRRLSHMHQPCVL